MIVDNQPFSLAFLFGNIIFAAKIGFIAFAILYFLFSLIVVRQVALMSETVITEGGGILKALSIIHAVLALGIIILFIAFF